ncbi:MAG: hypothetical protein OHK0045_00150 [Raineya sp.]
MEKIAKKIQYLLWLFLISISVKSQTIIPQEKKGKWGYVKQSNPKKFVIKPKYQQAEPFGKFLDSSRAFVKNNNLYGVIDLKGKWLIKPTYDSIYQQKKINEIFIFGRRGENNFLLNKKGEINSPEFSSLEPLNKEVFIFSKNKQLGLMLRKNEQFEVILPAEYENLGVANFKNTLFYVRKNGKVKFYDLTKQKFSQEYDRYNSIRVRDTLNERGRISYLVVEKERKKGLLDENLQTILPIEFNRIEQFRANEKVFFQVYKEGKAGLYNEQGKNILPIEFSLISSSFPYIIAQKDNLLGCYDQNGRQILSHLYEDIRFWKEQNAFLVTKEKLQGILSPEEKIISPILYTNLIRLNYQEPYYILASQEKQKSLLVFENNKTEKIHKENFEDLRQVEISPIVLIGKLKGKESLYLLENKKLQKILKEEFDQIEKLNKKYYWVRNRGKKYLLDKKTEKLIPLPEYTLLKDGQETYPISKREYKKYAEGQEQDTFYLEQEDKAFFWNVNTQKLIPTEKVKPFEKEEQNKVKTKPKRENKPKKMKKK